MIRRTAILSLLTVASALAALTTVSDTLYNPDGTTVNGSIRLAWPTFYGADGHLVQSGSKTITITNGVLSVSLEPTDTATPTGVVYTATYSITGAPSLREYWAVPTSTPAVALSSLRVLNPPTPGPFIPTVTNNSFSFTGGSQILVSSFNFTAISPASSLTGGSPATLTVACWPGIVTTGTYASKIYLSGGTGTAESVALTGGNCTSGSTGTIQFTPTNSHSGAYTITSSTAGLQECLNALPSGTGSCYFNPQTSVTVHGTTTAPVGRAVIDGGNLAGYQITRGSDFTSGPMILVPNGAVLAANNLGLTNTGGTADAAIKQVAGSSLTFSNSQVSGGAYCIEDDSGNGTALVGNWGCFNPTSKGLWFHSTTGTMAQNTSITGGYIFPAAGAHGIWIEGADVATVTGTGFGGGRIAVVINPGTGEFTNNLYFGNIRMDDPSLNCVAISDGGGTAQNIRFTGGHCHGAGSGTNQFGFDVGFSGASTVDGLTVSGMTIAAMGLAGIIQGSGPLNTIYAANDITDNNVSNDLTYNAGIVFSASAKSSTVSGNQIKSPGIYVGHQAFAIKTISGVTDMAWVGNDLSTNGTAALSLGGTFTGVIAENVGVSDVAGTVSDAATIALPVNPHFTVTGSGTGVTAVTANIPPNARGTFITTGGAIAFTAGASIGNSCTTTQNKLYNWLWDGTKFWLNGPGC